MKKKGGVNGVPIEKGSGNVYADLGYGDAEGMLVKVQLVAKIAEIIRQRGLTQEKAARLLRLTQPTISKWLKGQFRGVSERRLLRCLTRMGRDVEIIVKPAVRQRAGQFRVRFA
ncbi:MAG TPA: helix-turn-helix transcriptional regulator [Candidatus Acidoferrales bacterium]|nr:helix-turn-helix transcriptional regulator [Candidatus Acidoferrales bacterium]